MKQKRRVLISGYYGFDNFGDEVVLKILLDKLKDCHVTVLSANPRKTFEMYGVHTVHTFSYELVSRELARCDVLISGGGSLLQTVSSTRSLWFYLLIIQMALFMRKEVVIFAQGIGPIEGWWNIHNTKNVLKRCQYISVRDEKSLEQLKKWKIKHANLVCDPVFSLPVEQPEHNNKIGIQLRKFDTLTDDLFDNIVKILCSRYYNREIELICLQDEMDARISQLFVNKLKKVDSNINAKVIYGLNNQEIINRISQYDCLIGMRFHACLVAVKYGVKTLAIGYDPKVERLAEDIGIPCLSMDSSKNNYDAAFKAMESLSRWTLMNNAKNHVFNWDKTGINEIKKDKKDRKDNKKDKKKEKKKKK